MLDPKGNLEKLEREFNEYMNTVKDLQRDFDRECELAVAYCPVDDERSQKAAVMEVKKLPRYRKHVEIVSVFQGKIREATRMNVMTKPAKDKSESWAFLLDDQFKMNEHHMPTKHSAMVDYKKGAVIPKRSRTTRMKD